MEKSCSKCYWCEHGPEKLICHAPEYHHYKEANEYAENCSPEFQCRLWAKDDLNYLVNGPIAKCEKNGCTYEIQYYKAYMSIQCPVCNESTTVRFVRGWNTGRMITFGDFRGFILEETDIQGATMNRYVEKWFRGVFHIEGNEAYLLKHNGEKISLENLHEQIQNNPELQATIYNLYMTHVR